MTTPNNGELGLLTSTFPCRNSFIFLRCVLGTAAFVCSMFALVYHVEITEAKKNENTKAYEILADVGIAFCIIFFPITMLGKHFFICYFLPELSGKKARYCRIGLRIATLLMTSFTMLESVTATAIEVRKKDELKMIAYFLSSIILCEGALLDEDNYGVFELALTCFVVQFIKTFPKLGQPYWYGIILVVYTGRAVVMYSMKKMKEKVTRRREVGAKKRVENLDYEWQVTNNQLKDNHRINVDTDLPSFKRMKDIIDEMQVETGI